MYLKLVREKAQGKWVRGILYQVHFERLGVYGRQEQLTKICDTLENEDYIVNPLIYSVDVTMSPKFGRLLPILLQVPGRSGIRIHRGTKPEHSKGCILVPGAEMESYVTDMLLTCKRQGEEVRLEICG